MKRRSELCIIYTKHTHTHKHVHEHVNTYCTHTSLIVFNFFPYEQSKKESDKRNANNKQASSEFTITIHTNVSVKTTCELYTCTYTHELPVSFEPLDLGTHVTHLHTTCRCGTSTPPLQTPPAQHTFTCTCNSFTLYLKIFRGKVLNYNYVIKLSTC